MRRPAALHVVERRAEADGELGVEVPLVVIVHGAMDRATSFGRVARGLRDLDVVRYDRCGYGQSLDGGPVPLDAHVDDLLAVIGDRAAIVFGHSIGGVVALAAAARVPERIPSILAFEPPMPWAPWWPHRPALDDPADEAEAFMRRAVGDQIWGRLPARTRADRRAEGEALLADMAALRGEAPYDPAAVAVPVVVGCGSETTWWHRRAAEELAQALPRGELAVVGGAQHGAHLSHPAAVVGLVRTAVDLARRSGDGGGRR